MTPCAAAIKTWPGDSEDVSGAERRPVLTAAAQGAVGMAGRDEETVLRPNKETRSDGRRAGDFGWFGKPRRSAGDDGIDDDE